MVRFKICEMHPMKNGKQANVAGVQREESYKLETLPMLASRRLQGGSRRLQQDLAEVFLLV
jgi:hypothetical protein